MINRRRAPSSEISSYKKKMGHKNEEIYASLINGFTISGTQKGDVRDKNGKNHSVKSGKKWQIFLYGEGKINSSLHLNILKSCLDAFPNEYHTYFHDRTECIALREELIKLNGELYLKGLTNNAFGKLLNDKNTYIDSKKNYPYRLN